MVAPYNAQVALIRAAIAEAGFPEARVGTVDKFQGQEAVVAIYSLASSSSADAPRGMEFLYALDRLNVATSRARCATVVICSPAVYRADCKRPAQISDVMLEDSGLDPDRYRDFTFFEGGGCIECNGTGYRGRLAIAELLNLSDNIRQLILDRRSAAEIKRAAKAEGMRFLRESALQKVFAGETSLHDVHKVTFVE